MNTIERPHDALDVFLRERKPSELLFLETGQLSDSYSQMASTVRDGRKLYIFDGYIPQHEDFYIRQQSRFSPVPEHKHNFIEISYVYDGHITQFIDGRKITLNRGELCLIDTEVSHSIEPAGEEDIIINILLKRDYFRNRLLVNLFTKSIITDFILNVVSKTANHRQYIIFRNREFRQIHSIVCDILRETFFPNIGSLEAINHYLNIFFIELVRDFEYETNGNVSRQDTQILAILKYMDTHTESVTLSSLARKFNYSPNYLSTLLKKKTGKGFSEIVLDKRLIAARMLLLTTNMPISEVADLSGFTNPTFFYKKYKEKFRQLPSERDHPS